MPYATLTPDWEAFLTEPRKAIHIDRMSRARRAVQEHMNGNLEKAWEIGNKLVQEIGCTSGPLFLCYEFLSSKVLGFDYQDIEYRLSISTKCKKTILYVLEDNMSHSLMGNYGDTIFEYAEIPKVNLYVSSAQREDDAIWAFMLEIKSRDGLRIEAHLLGDKDMVYALQTATKEALQTLKTKCDVILHITHTQAEILQNKDGWLYGLLETQFHRHAIGICYVDETHPRLQKAIDEVE